MPSKNTVKEYAENAYYHIYNRGVNKRRIFAEDVDFRVMLNIFKRHLSPKTVSDRYGRPYPNYSNQINLLAFCLMPNHFHLLIFQTDSKAITKLMSSAMTSYVGYFNKKYQRVGPLFQERFKASVVDNEAYLWHISRYIHLNPLSTNKKFERFAYSSYPYFTGAKSADWIKPQRILSMHGDSKVDYEEFVHDYIDYKETLKDVKLELA